MAVLGICMLAVVGGAQAQVWKCRNAQTGRVEYSGIPCDGNSASGNAITVRPNEVDSSGSREQAVRAQIRERVENLRSGSVQAGGMVANTNNTAGSACASAQSAYDNALASGRVTVAVLRALQNRAAAACSRN